MPPKKRTRDDKSSEPAAKLNRTDSDFDSMDFSNEAASASGAKWNFKISSWNVDGLRAWIKKDGLKFFKHEDPDIVCLQETKCSEDKLPTEIKDLGKYPHKYWCSASKEGYSGVALLSKTKPLSVDIGLEGDDEGRVITAEYDKFYLVTAYVPNAGRKLVTLPKRMEWDPVLRKHLIALDKKKPVILCGDLNVARLEIDLANPKTNKKTAGFTKEERDSFEVLLKDGNFVDSFRHFYPDRKDIYTFWTYMMGARARNVGWRLDYFVISQRYMKDHVADNVIRDKVYGSDHCPSTLFIAK